MTGAEEETGTHMIHNMGQGEMGLRMLGRRQVTPRWANDSVWLNDGRGKENGQGRIQALPDRNLEKVGEGRSELRRREYFT